MTREEAIKYIKSRCIGSTEERDGTQWSEAMWTAIEALAYRPKNMIHIDEVYRLIAGHSNYHGDSILSAFTCLVEGKDVKPIAPLDESADRPTGEWVDIDNYYRMATCSNCHKVTMFEKWGEYTRSYNYCPNCGADMREPKLQYGDTDTLQGGLMSAT